MVKGLVFSDTVKTPVEQPGMVVRHEGTSEGTGSEQTIDHGFGTTWEHLTIEYYLIDTGATMTSFSFDNVSGRDHFHLTVTSGKAWGWRADSW